MWSKMGEVAKKEVDSGNTAPSLSAKLKSRDFFFSQMWPEITVLLEVIKNGKSTLMQFDEGEL